MLVIVTFRSDPVNKNVVVLRYYILNATRYYYNQKKGNILGISWNIYKLEKILEILLLRVGVLTGKSTFLDPLIYPDMLIESM